MFVAIQHSTGTRWQPKYPIVYNSPVPVVSDDVDIEFLYNHYEFQPFIDKKRHLNGTFGTVEVLLLAPCFHSHGKFFLREIHRLGNYSLLFYQIRPRDYCLDNGQRRSSAIIPCQPPINNLIGYMLPLFPRKIPEYDPEHLLGE